MNQFDPASNMPMIPGSDPMLPQGDSAQGMTAGSQGGLSAAAIQKGFDNVTVPATDFCGDGQEETDPKLNPEGTTFGFLERPQGWQR